MILVDVNVLVYAQRTDVPDHREYREWLETILNGDEVFGVSELVLSGVIRILTHPKIFKRPTPLKRAQEYVGLIRNAELAAPVHAGTRHWDIFQSLLGEAGARGNLVPDAYLAALAIESGCEWITTDRDFSRFRRLRWRHPLRA